MANEVLTFVGGGEEGPSSSAAADVVFVHGLAGDHIKTWSGRDGAFWPAWIATDFPNCNIYTASYETALFRGFLSGPGASLQDLASILADSLASRPHPAGTLGFVTHSLGGLVVKQLLRKCRDSSDAKLNALGQSVGAIAFLGTPHMGAQLGTSLDLILRNSKSKVCQQLGYSNSELLDLHEFFRAEAVRSNISVKSYYETQHTWGVQVVDRITANPAVHGIDPIAVQADHIGICKPDDRGAAVFRSVSNLIEALRGCAASSETSQIEPGAPDNPPVPAGLETVPDYGAMVAAEHQIEGLAACVSQGFLVSVEGLSGSGKTYLVSRFVRNSWSTLGWSRLIWYDASLEDSLDDLIAALPDMDVLPEWTDKAKAQAIVAFLQTNRALMVIDDFHTANPQAFGCLLDAASGRAGLCGLVLIGQLRVAGRDFSRPITRYVPDMFDVEQVRQFVDARVPGRLELDQYVRLFRTTEGLPFAIALFCILIGEFGYSAESLLRGGALRDERLDLWCENAVQHVPPDDRNFLFAMALVDGPIDHDLIESIARAISVDRFRERFERILGWHLLRRQSASSWSMHSILSQYCRRRLAPDVRRLVLTGIAERYRDLRRNPRGASDKFAKFSTWALACRYYIAAGDTDTAERLLLRLAPTAKRIGHFSMLKGLLVTLEEALAPGWISGWSTYHLAHCMFVTGELVPAQACLERLLERPRVPDMTLRLSCQRLLADVLLARGRVREALESINIAERIAAAETVNRTAYLQFLGTKFQVLLELGSLREAEQIVQQTLKMVHGRRDNISSGIVQMQISQVSEAKGLHENAAELARQAKKDFEAAQDQRGMLWAEAQIGLCQIRQGLGAEGLATILASARKQAPFELWPHRSSRVLTAALNLCADPADRRFLQEQIRRAGG